MKRRNILRGIAGILAGAVLDTERDLWVPGKTISIPKSVQRRVKVGDLVWTVTGVSETITGTFPVYNIEFKGEPLHLTNLTEDGAENVRGRIWGKGGRLEGTWIDSVHASLQTYSPPLLEVGDRILLTEKESNWYNGITEGGRRAWGPGGNTTTLCT